jgi:hypothetical protein
VNVILIQIWLQVRWAGFIRPTGTDEYTFNTIDAAGLAADKNDRVRLWIDSKLIIDQWVSLASLTPSATTSIPAVNDYYELNMHYKVSSWGGPSFTGVTSQSLATICPTSGNQFRLGSSAASTANLYVNMYVMFTSGVCAGKWSKILTYTNQADDNAFTVSGSTLTATSIDLGNTAVAEDGYYVGATLIISCFADGTTPTQTATVTSYVGTIAGITTITNLCAGPALPAAGTASYKVTGYQKTKCATVANSWSDGATTSCTTTAGDSYSLYYGTRANLQIKGGLIATPRSIASNELFISSNIQSSPFRVNVSCALTDFPSSIIAGLGLSIATVRTLDTVLKIGLNFSSISAQTMQIVYCETQILKLVDHLCRRESHQFSRFRLETLSTICVVLVETAL